MIAKRKIRNQLNRILGSPQFLSAERPSQLLNFLVEQSLSNKQHRIKQYTIAVEVFGYRSDFDPQSDSIVRMQARRLRRALCAYYDGQGIEDPIRIEVPKGTYVPVFLDNPQALNAPDSSESTSPVPTQTSLHSYEPTIAVVALEKLNGRDENAFLARGLTSEIVVSLTRFSGLKVLGPLQPEKGNAIDFHKVNHEYGAQFVLRGWVREDRSRFRITVDLTEAPTGTNLWSKTFEYDPNQAPLFEFEDDVASHVTGAIADGLGVIFRRLRTDTYSEHLRLGDVTLAVLEYNNAWQTEAPKDFERALSAVRDGLKRHPKEALLVALLANLCYAEVIHHLNIIPDAPSIIEGLANKAISLDPNLQVAQYNLVPINAYFGRVERCVEQAQKVIKMNPNHARILAGCAVATTEVGAYDVGLDYVEQARRLNPHYPSWYHLVDYLVHYGNGRFEEAWAEAQKIHIEGSLWHPLFRASILGTLGRVEEAKVYMDELMDMKPDLPKRPTKYLRPVLVLDKHVEMMWDGLRKAGLK